MSTNDTLKPIWPTRECTRCGGCGRYSWCAQYGDTCFKCSGTGRQFANAKVEAIVIAYRAHLRSLKECQAQELAPGQHVYVSGGRLSSRKDGMGEWVEVFDATVDLTQWSGKSNGIVTAWRTNVTLVDGSVHSVAGNHIVRTMAPAMDATPWVERCRFALGKTPKAAARAAYESDLVAAGWNVAA